MGLPFATNQNNPEPTSPILCDTNSIGLCTTQWAIWLQQNATSPNVMCSQGSQKSDTCDTWAYHSVDGWYLSTSPNHYQTHLCLIKSTQSDQLSNTVHFKHKNITNPFLTHADKIMKAIADLANVLKRKPTVTAKQEQETWDLHLLMENIHIP